MTAVRYTWKAGFGLQGIQEVRSYAVWDLSGEYVQTYRARPFSGDVDGSL